MTFRQFLVPSEQDIIETFGIVPEPVADAVATRSLTFTTDAGDSLTVTYDVPGRSVYCAWKHGDTLVHEATREGATRLSMEWDKPTGRIIIDFTTDELSGQMPIQVYPSFNVTDTMLLR